MPLIYATGDLLNSDCTDIAHQANCFNVMGTGIARRIALIHIEAEIVDKATKKGDRTKLGTWTSAYSKGRTIYNCYTQYAYGRDKRYTSYDAMEECFSKLDKLFRERTLPYKFGIPYRIGCNNAGGNWEIVQSILHNTFTNTEVYIYKLEK